MLFNSSQIPYISFLKKSCFKYFSFSLLPLIDIEIKLDVNEIMEIPVCVQKNFFGTKITFYTFDIELYNTTIPHFCVQYVKTIVHQYYLMTSQHSALKPSLNFCQYSMHDCCVFQLSNILFFVYYFFYFWLAVVNFFLEHCLFL